jgi:hypothetical protein
MPSPTCHDVFNTARAERAKYPLAKGQCKLEEAERTIERWQQMLETIADRIRAGGKFGETENLGPCMAHERGTYLKQLPLHLAELVGYEILPGIAALEGDGVPKAEVQRLLHRAKTDAQRLLAEYETVRLRLQAGIGSEYRAMRQGESELQGLLSDARALTPLRPLCTNSSGDTSSSA